MAPSVHKVFHVLHLKKALGRDVVSSPILLLLDDEGRFELIPEEILDTKERQLRRAIK